MNQNSENNCPAKGQKQGKNPVEKALRKWKLSFSGVYLFGEQAAPGGSDGTNAAGISAGTPGKPFQADRTDGIFALFAFVLGFFFVRWILLSWQGWGVAVFTAVYCGAMVFYLQRKGVSIKSDGWFWMGIVLLTGFSYSLWENNGLEPFRSLLLICGAIYFVLCAAHVLLMGKTSNWILLDGFNGFILIPLKNFNCQYKSLGVFKCGKKSAWKQIISVVLGILLAVLILILILPLLMRADSGGFTTIMNSVLYWIRWIKIDITRLILDGMLAIPAAAYIFGLAAGCAHKRACVPSNPNGLKNASQTIRMLPAATVYILLGAICLIYMLFIGCQLPYFFSAFFGERPEGMQIYSVYARSGFFELCEIAAINLSVLTASNLLCKTKRTNSVVLKAFNCFLSLLTILLICTAFSKMALYIHAYGLSVPRILPCFFMLFLFVVCVGIILLQKFPFSILRLAAVSGASILCTLCLLDPGGFAARYNADRYLAGTLVNFDVEILYRSGPAGVEPALQVYAQTGDKTLKVTLRDYLSYQQEQARTTKQTAQDNFQRIQAREKIAAFFKLHPTV